MYDRAKAKRDEREGNSTKLKPNRRRLGHQGSDTLRKGRATKDGKGTSERTSSEVRQGKEQEKREGGREDGWASDWGVSRRGGAEEPK